MNPYIDDDLQALAEHARRFASGRVAPGFLERDQTRVLDRTLMREMGQMGFIAPELPENVGGQGMGSLAAGVIHEEIARADLSLSYINLLASLNGQILNEHGNPSITRPWLAKLTQGEALLAIALTEPRGGSDAANSNDRRCDLWPVTQAWLCCRAAARFAAPRVSRPATPARVRETLPGRGATALCTALPRNQNNL